MSPGAHWLTAGVDGSLYVTNPAEGSVSVVPPGRVWTERSILAGPYPVEVAVAKDGTAYATNEYEGTVTVVPAGSPSPSHTIPVGAKDHPHGIAAAPDGTVYVTNSVDNTVSVIPPGATAAARPGLSPRGQSEVLQPAVLLTELPGPDFRRLPPGRRPCCLAAPVP